MLLPENFSPASDISTLVEMLVSKEKPFALGRRFFSFKFRDFVVLSAHVFAEKRIRKSPNGTPKTDTRGS